MPLFPVQTTKFISCLVFAGSMISTPVFAQENSKSEPLATDRPDFVESGQVVGKGRFQFETGISYDRSKQDGVKASNYNTPALFRFGVGETWELRLETDGYTRARAQATGFPSTSEGGFSDIALGTKWQMQEGDDATGRPAIAWLLHADLDTGSAPFRGQGVRPSLRMVAEWELPGDVSVGLMPGIAMEKMPKGNAIPWVSWRSLPAGL